VSFAQALIYFIREAFLSLARSWKVSLLAIVTIAMSLFMAGVFLLVAGNLEEMIVRWRAETKVVIYLDAAATDEDQQRLTEHLSQPVWSLAVESVTSEEARERFRTDHPSLADLLEGWGDDPLPASFEVSLDLELLESHNLDPWLATARTDPAVVMVDDDRDTLGQLDAVVLVLRGLGMVLGTILLLTAIFTISSVIRLTAYLYRDEIAVMRLVGATEFFIRGPFYLEGLLQGLAGGALAILALAAGYGVWIEESRGSVLAVLTGKFLEPVELLALVALGGLAGLIGAVSSLRKETLGETAESGEWSA
jgi:cell division transport system permease protein